MRFDAAFDSIEEAERLTPDDAEPLTTKALVLFSQGDNAGDSAQLNLALAQKPDDVSALYIAARQARYMGDKCVVFWRYDSSH